MISTLGLTACATLTSEAHPEPPPIGTDDHVHVGQVLEDLQAHGAESVEDLGLVALLHVVVAGAVDQLVAVGLGVVEVAVRAR